MTLELPTVAACSPAYTDTMKSLSIEVRQGLCMARFKQSPINETLRLWDESEGENMQLFNIRFHEFQEWVPKSRMLDALRNVAVSCTNNIGIDLYTTMTNTNLHYCIPFVSGLGEFKGAEFIKRFLITEDNISFRTSTCVLPKKVHYNAVGFMNASKFRRIKGRNETRALDCSRIHPEFYSIATKMAKSALDGDLEGDEAIKAILSDPSKLRQLDLEQFSQRCELMFGKDYKSIFYFIRDELETPFRETRGEYAEYESKMINAEQVLFYTLTGENKDNFYEGLHLPVIVTKIVKEETVACRSLGKSNWIAYLNKDNAAENIKDLLLPGFVVSAKITKIEFDRLSVSISALDEKVTEKEILDRIPTAFKPHFKVDLEKDGPIRISTEISDRFGPGNKYKARTYGNYSNFQNITVGQANGKLSNKARGAFVFRPSPRGERWLNLSIKLFDKHIIHIEIKEEKGEDGQSTFYIGDASFASMKEIEINYIRELNKRVSNLADSPKFYK